MQSIKTGDKVITAGGIHGVVTNMKDNSFIVKIADNVKIEVSKSGVTTVLPKDGNGSKSENSKDNRK
jgi:preprotein translocase subunit YajC